MKTEETIITAFRSDARSFLRRNGIDSNPFVSDAWVITALREFAHLEVVAAEKDDENTDFARIKYFQTEVQKIFSELNIAIPEAASFSAIVEMRYRLSSLEKHLTAALSK